MGIGIKQLIKILKKFEKGYCSEHLEVLCCVPEKENDIGMCHTYTFTDFIIVPTIYGKKCLVVKLEKENPNTL